IGVRDDETYGLAGRDPQRREVEMREVDRHVDGAPRGRPRRRREREDAHGDDDREDRRRRRAAMLHRVRTAEAWIRRRTNRATIATPTPRHTIGRPPSLPST